MVIEYKYRSFKTLFGYEFIVFEQHSLKNKIMKLKSLLFVALLFLLSSSYAQSVHKTKNVGVILIDGYRWQELFKGADFDLLNDKKYTPNDSSQRFKKSGQKIQMNEETKLMPFT